MPLKIISFHSNDENLFEKARNIRDLVFIQEQEVEEEEEFDEFEATSLHFLMSINGKAIGTARWRTVGEKVKLERFAVLKEHRGRKHGDALLKAVIDSATTAKKPMYLHAQLKAIPFYGREGFNQVGELFVECEIEHYKMVRGYEL